MKLANTVQQPVTDLMHSVILEEMTEHSFPCTEFLKGRHLSNLQKQKFNLVNQREQQASYQSYTKLQIKDLSTCCHPCELVFILQVCCITNDTCVIWLRARGVVMLDFIIFDNNVSCVFSLAGAEMLPFVRQQFHSRLVLTQITQK